MSRRLLLSPRAVDDLIEIWRYIAENDPAAANALLDALDMRMGLLREQPYLGRPRPELASGLRSVAVGNYLILYRVRRDRIVIVRCVHGARRLGRLV